MSVESKGSKPAVKRDGDKNFPGPGLVSRIDAAPKELAGLKSAFAQRRIMRDTTNHPDVELKPSSGSRQAAIGRRMKRGATTKGSPRISDSGAADSVGGDSGDGGSSLTQ